MTLGTDVDGGPLAGRTVVVTRSDNRSLCSLLHRLGARTVEFPLTVQLPIDGATERLHAALDNLPVDGWVLVTSAVGASSLVEARMPASIRVGAVGTATAEALSLVGITADVVAPVQQAVGLVDALPPGPATALFVGAHDATVELPEGLRAKGWRVETVAVYRTAVAVAHPERRAEVSAADAIVFMAGSAVRAFVANVGIDALPPVVVSIGPNTTREARTLGVDVHATASSHSLDGLIAELVRKLE